MNNAQRVYSSDQGRLCSQCGRPPAQCQCGKKPAAPLKGSGQVRVGRQTQGRKGKGVTVITGLPLAEGELLALARDLKQRCGTGGTVKDGVIEIQGDHRDLLVTELEKRGYAAKRSGG
ncbi:MAG: translation initiation factor Sui1 [Candidatus Latescibacteria bacterium]|nr:translation initiation factor Sui1 [Candidatus Latescibacterota bacterium]